jgi:transcriptional regulator with XRE-family HTH domain
MEDSRQRFAALVKAGRERLGLKQEDLAAELGVRQPTVSGWENGRRIPAFGLAVKVARRLGIDATEMVEILTAVDSEAAGAVEPEAVAG